MDNHCIYKAPMHIAMVVYQNHTYFYGLAFDMLRSKKCLSVDSIANMPMGVRFEVGDLLSSSEIKTEIRICNLRLIWVYIDLLMRCHQGATSKFTP